MSAIYAIPTKLLLRIPLINNEIADAPLNVNKGLLTHKLTFPFSDKIIANSQAGLKAYKAPQIKSNVIYNGFDFERLINLEDKILIRNKFSIKTTLVVAMVANFTDKKDYSTYIRSAYQVLEQGIDVTFLCIGSGDQSTFKKKVLKGFEDRILFIGQQTNIESIMNICDIGVLMSNVENHGEGISNALLEFMALKKPVVATDNGGSKELIDNFITGFLIKPNDDKSLAYDLTVLLKNKTKRNKMGMASRRRVKDFFSIDKMILDFINEYEQLC
jgi:glycosyltransferase involved in cell wall biosynthesis